MADRWVVQEAQARVYGPRVAARTSDGKAFRILTIIDEHTRECLAMVVKRSITSRDVLDRLYMLLLVRGVPEHIRSDNGPEFTSRAVRGWLSNLGVKAMFIEPGNPWENGYVESFDGKLRDELLNRAVIQHPDRSPDTNRAVEKRI